MELRRELFTSMVLLLFFNLCLSFASVALLDRMSLGAERVMKHNLQSVDATEEMAMALARHAYEPTDATRTAFQEALRRARANVTERGEGDAVDLVERLSGEFLEGNDVAFDGALVAIQGLSQLNKAAIERNSRESQRYGKSGMWAAVAIGFLSFLFTLRLMRRLKMRVALPLEEALAVAEAGRAGDLFRRCPKRETPREIIRLASAVNGLLDRLTILGKQAEVRSPAPPADASTDKPLPQAPT